MAVFCEYSEENLDCIKNGEFIDQFNNYHHSVETLLYLITPWIICMILILIFCWHKIRELIDALRKWLIESNWLKVIIIFLLVNWIN
jgi:hypothetical protein